MVLGDEIPIGAHIPSLEGSQRRSVAHLVAVSVLLDDILAEVAVHRERRLDSLQLGVRAILLRKVVEAAEEAFVLRLAVLDEERHLLRPVLWRLCTHDRCIVLCACVCVCVVTGQGSTVAAWCPRLNM